MGNVGSSCPRVHCRGTLDVTSNDACTEIRVAVLGEWMPSQLADVLALQRAEEPDTAIALVECAANASAHEPTGGRFDFAVSASEVQWPGWVCEALWHDTLAVAVAKRSHLLAYREVPCHELSKQPLICVQSAAGESWHAQAHRPLEDRPQGEGQKVGTFDMAMTLVAAGYGVTIAPTARLAGYQCKGVAVRPLADAPMIVTAYLLRPSTSLNERQDRFAQRARSVS